MAWLQGYGDAYPPSLSYDNSNMNLHQYGASTDSFGGDPFADGRAPKLPYHKKYSDADGASKEALTAGMGSAGAKQKRGAWMEGGKEPASPSSWKRWTIIGIVALLVLGGAAGGLVAWKLQSDKKNANPESSQAGGTLSSASKDPSSFTKDDRLHPSFYGVAYTVSERLPCANWCRFADLKTAAECTNANLWRYTRQRDCRDSDYFPAHDADPDIWFGL